MRRAHGCVAVSREFVDLAGCTAGITPVSSCDKALTRRAVSIGVGHTRRGGVARRECTTPARRTGRGRAERRGGESLSQGAPRHGHGSAAGRRVGATLEGRVQRARPARAVGARRRREQVRTGATRRDLHGSARMIVGSRLPGRSKLAAGTCAIRGTRGSDVSVPGAARCDSDTSALRLVARIAERSAHDARTARRIRRRGSCDVALPRGAGGRRVDHTLELVRGGRK